MRHIERSENYWIGSKEPLEDGIYEERPVPDENAKRCHTCEHGYWKYYHYKDLIIEIDIKPDFAVQ
jgi:uncharacterized protein with PIN domain